MQLCRHCDCKIFWPREILFFFHGQYFYGNWKKKISTLFLPMQLILPTIIEEGFRAVRTNVTSTFYKAFQHPEWGEPARAEFNTIFLDTRSVIEILNEIAQIHIQKGAEVWIYASLRGKVKEGKVARKVRLILNGKKHNIHGSTYSSTLCRETFLTLMHIGAVLDWNFFHFDEKRSISERLKTWWHHYKSQNSWRFPILRNYWSTIWPKDCFDYKTTVQWSLERMQFLGFSTLDYCISTYYKSQSRNICIIYEYVFYWQQ